MDQLAEEYKHGVIFLDEVPTPSSIPFYYFYLPYTRHMRSCREQEQVEEEAEEEEDSEQML